jgi:DNA-3-methyladenine glycosylase I
MMIPNVTRCGWAESDALLLSYHDTEWGVPVHEDRLLFEMLNLEGAQAGLSWLTVLRKRAHYQRVFDQFDPAKLALYDAAQKETLLSDAGIVRNRLKINAVIENAQAVLRLQQEVGSFDKYLWAFIGEKPLNRAQTQEATAISLRMSKDLKKRGFRFVGPTICFAFMQAVGMINDHDPACFRAKQII